MGPHTHRRLYVEFSSLFVSLVKEFRSHKLCDLKQTAQGVGGYTLFSVKRHGAFGVTAFFLRETEVPIAKVQWLFGVSDKQR